MGEHKLIKKKVIKATENDIKKNNDLEPIEQAKPIKFKSKLVYKGNFTYIDPSEFSIVWHNIGLFIVLHYFYIKSLYGYLTLDPDAIKCAPIVLIWGYLGGMGVTAGAHRLWSHRTYSAKLPLRILLMIGHTIAGQNNLYVWCRDHRVHHKYSETDADPHNSLRGFFFAHMGWLLRRKHPDVMSKGINVDTSDLLNDPVIRFQIKFYYPMFLLINLVLPIWASMYFFNVSFMSSLTYSFFQRYALSLHTTWFVNSAAHMFGEKPYNLRIQPVENLFVSAFAAGEGFHNYHHSYPWDYAASEFSKFNITKSFIDGMAHLGQAYDLKRARKAIVDASKETVIKRNIQKIAAY